MGSGGSAPVQTSRQEASRNREVLREREERHGQVLLAPEGPTDSQGPSPYATLRRDEIWPQDPSAPSLPGGLSIRGSYLGPCEANAPQEETLLTYAAQMTEWQSSGGSNLHSSRNEVMELSRTVSCLAAANQQLAAAHSAALAHLEMLYRDVRSARLLTGDCEKEFNLREEEREDLQEPRRETRRRASRCRSLGSRHDDEESLEFCGRIRRESQLRLPEVRSENGDQEEQLVTDLAEVKSVEDTERLRLPEARSEGEQPVNNVADLEGVFRKLLAGKLRENLENFLNIAEVKNALRKAFARKLRERLENSLNSERLQSTCDKESQNDGVGDTERLRLPELRSENGKQKEGPVRNFGEFKTVPQRASTGKSRERLENPLNGDEKTQSTCNDELQSDGLKDTEWLRLPDVRSDDGDEKEEQPGGADLAEFENALRNGLARKLTESLENFLNNGKALSTCDKELQCDNGVGDIERLKTKSDEIHRLNEEVKKDVEIQRQTIERLKEENEASTVQREKAERESRERIDELVGELDCSKMKTIELLKEKDSFRMERDSALARISSLEHELQKSVVDRDNARIADAQKSTKLRAQLAEEVADKKKQIRALETALEEIQRLKLAVKTDKRDSAGPERETAETGTEFRSGSPVVLETVDEIPEDMNYSRATNMEEFKKELTLKREARQRAIAAVSSEMDRLRRELGAEKEAHSETSRMLDLLKSGEPAGETCGSVITVENNHTQDEIQKLRTELQEEKEAHQETLRRITAQQIADTLKVSDEIRNFVRFEAEKLEDLRYHLERDTEKNERQIFAVKEAVAAARLVLAARDKQVNKLKDQLAHILARLDGMNYSVIFDDARAEFDHQLENLRNLKTLYEVRLKILIELQEHAMKELATTKEKFEISQKKVKTLEEDLAKSEEKVDVQDTEISNLESQLGLTKADCRDLENQMSVINSLFTQMLLSASSADMDLDRLTRLLQENHDLISDMAREEGTEAAALPKLLLDLVEQVEGRSPTKPRTSSGEGAEKNEEDTLQEGNIAHNLPKVWRVLLELLSCHAVDVPSTSASELSAPDSCYKSVDTPSGPQLVISVSKTYIRLKELILEKKQLEKEMTRMKQLNTHLESKLGEQEKRLSTVSSELSKTWNIVGRMQAQHQQLHTHEKILRYELQQKRKMLQELKQELEYCKEKWESARQKNTNTEMEWKNLRREFAARKALAVRDSLNNSGESGFSDERGDESDEEDEGRAERIRISPRRRTRKESPRVPSPDTESEQPTDTEMSESKTCSSETLEQRTPTPETETEADAETIDADPVSNEPRPATPQPDCSPEVEILDPLDRALTNVIQSLIKIDTVSNPSSASVSSESISVPSTSKTLNEVSKKSSPRGRNAREWSPHSEPWSTSNADIKVTTLSLKKPSKSGSSQRSSSFDSLDTAASRSENGNGAVNDGEFSPRACSSLAGDSVENSTEMKAGLCEGEETLEIEGRDSDRPPTVSVFSIGPYPTCESPSPVKTVQFREPLVLESSGSPSAVAMSEEEDESCDGGSSSSENTEPAENEVKMDGEKDRRKTKSPDLKESTKSNDETPKADPEDESESQSITEKQEEIPASPLPVEPAASTSAASSSAAKASRTPEEVLAARAARLKRLEEQADWLMKKMNATSQRGSALSSRLEELHEVYGEPPAPPPLPDVLPSVRLQTNYEEEEGRDRRVPSEAAGSATEVMPPSNEAETHTDANESPPNNAP